MIKRESISSRVLPYVPHPNRLRVKGDDKRLKKAIFEYGTCRIIFSQSFRNKSEGAAATTALLLAKILSKISMRQASI